MIKILTSLTREKARRSIVVFFFLSAVLPLLILLYFTFNHVLPVLSGEQVNSLALIFTLCILAMLGLPFLGFFLVHRWILSLEALAREVRNGAAGTAGAAGLPEDPPEQNEVLALRKAFLHLRGELEDRMGKVFHYSDRLIQTSEKLYELSFTDELTSLYNRRYFDFRLAEEVSRADRYGHDLSIIMIDINDFKLYNDTYGHYMGDEILRRFGNLIRDVIRKSDIPFRYGGDEFAILLPESSADMAEVVARRMNAALDTLPLRDDGGNQVVGVSASCGVAAYTRKSGGEDFVRKADMLLLKSKGEKKGRIARLDPIGGNGADTQQ
ncbi:MAG TPA: GGDEF domain-containing protein [Syntrophales bacterium]|nr:GGDEF domain-containing protein [Syntrophales bacterium]